MTTPQEDWKTSLDAANSRAIDEFKQMLNEKLEEFRNELRTALGQTVFDFPDDRQEGEEDPDEEENERMQSEIHPAGVQVEEGDDDEGDDDEADDS